MLGQADAREEGEEDAEDGDFGGKDDEELVRFVGDGVEEDEGEGGPALLDCYSALLGGSKTEQDPSVGQKRKIARWQGLRKCGGCPAREERHVHDGRRGLRLGDRAAISADSHGS